MSRIIFSIFWSNLKLRTQRFALANFGRSQESRCNLWKKKVKWFERLINQLNTGSLWFYFPGSIRKNNYLKHVKNIFIGINDSFVLWETHDYEIDLLWYFILCVIHTIWFFNRFLVQLLFQLKIDYKINDTSV